MLASSLMFFATLIECAAFMMNMFYALKTNKILCSAKCWSTFVPTLAMTIYVVLCGHNLLLNSSLKHLVGSPQHTPIQP